MIKVEKIMNKTNKTIRKYGIEGKSYQTILEMKNSKYKQFREKLKKEKSKWLDKTELRTFLTTETINKYFPNPNLTRLVKTIDGKEYIVELYCLNSVKKALEKGQIPIRLEKSFYQLFDCQLKKIQKLVEWYSKTPKP